MSNAPLDWVAEKMRSQMVAIAHLNAEVERLRADYAELHRAFWLMWRVSLPPHDISGMNMCREALSIVNALPAPQEKEE